MKVIFSSNYGALNFPEPILDLAKRVMEQDKERWRFNKELILAIENLPIVDDYQLGTIKRHTEDEFGSWDSWVSIYEHDATKNSSLSIIDVDISKPWRISEYDGAESLRYLESEVPEYNLFK